MQVLIKRLWETNLSVCGEMYVDGLWQCYSLEPARIDPVNFGHPCIEAGTYKVILTESPHLGYVCPEVLDVPERTAIRWHIANRPIDVLGCVGVGQSHAIDWVGHSKAAFEALMLKLKGHDITAIYTDP